MTNTQRGYKLVCVSTRNAIHVPQWRLQHSVACTVQHDTCKVSTHHPSSLNSVVLHTVRSLQGGVRHIVVVFSYTQCMITHCGAYAGDKLTFEIIVEVVIPYWMALSVLSHLSSWIEPLQYLRRYIYISNILHTRQSEKYFSIIPQQVYSQ